MASHLLWIMEALVRLTCDGHPIDLVRIYEFVYEGLQGKMWLNEQLLAHVVTRQ